MRDGSGGESSSGAGLISLFDLTADSFPFHPQRVSHIVARRTALHDSLIFDFLLSSGGINDPPSFYPPTDAESLKRLLDAIETSRFDSVKKDSLVYFLLKWHQDAREESFHKARCIPPQFRILSDAYWHLDSGIHVERAVSLLSDRRLNRDYTSKIIHIFSLSPDPSRLIVQYIQAAKPPLLEGPDIDKYALALAEHSGLVVAWQYQKTYPETNEHRPRIWKRILQWTVHPSPQPKALQSLLTLPLTPFEHKVLVTMSSDSSLPVSALAMLQDLVCVRFIQMGKYLDAIQHDRLFSAAIPDSAKVDQIRERERMCRDVYKGLPEIDRLSLDSFPQPTPLRPALEGSTASLQSSWVEVGSHSKSANGLPQLPPASPPKQPTIVQAPLIPTSTPAKKQAVESHGAKPAPFGSSVFGKNRRPPLPFSPLTPLADSTTTKPSDTTFKSAKRQPNAFYNPPPLPERVPLNNNPFAHINGLGGPISPIEPLSTEPALTPADETALPDGEEPPEADDALSFSLFSGATHQPLPLAAPQSSVGPSTRKPRMSSEDLNRSVPGAFVLDDDATAASPLTENQAVGMTGRTSVTRKASYSVQEDIPNKRPRIPGGLEDGDSEEGEETDEIAPLPPPSKKGGRKGRGSSIVDDTAPRRRSSRLSSTAEGPSTKESTKKGPSRGRKKRV